jgi:hypothetical protein
MGFFSQWANSINAVFTPSAAERKSNAALSIRWFGRAILNHDVEAAINPRNSRFGLV